MACAGLTRVGPERALQARKGGRRDQRGRRQVELAQVLVKQHSACGGERGGDEHLGQVGRAQGLVGPVVGVAQGQEG